MFYRCFVERMQDNAKLSKVLKEEDEDETSKDEISKVAKVNGKDNAKDEIAKE